MTLLHICDYSPPYKGNFIPSLESLEQQAGVNNVYLFPFRANKTGAMEWINDLNKNGSVAYVQKKNMLLNIFLLFTILKKHKVDFICRHFHDGMIDVVVKLLFNPHKVLRFMHCMYEGRAVIGCGHKFRQLLWKGNVLVGVSEAVSIGLRKAFPVSKVITIENGIFFPRLDGDSVFDFGEKSESSGVLVCMGYDVRVKGVDLALKAVNAIRETGIKNWTLNIIAASHRDDLMAYVKAVFGSIPDWVRILPPTSDIGSYFRGADILLAPSRTEACPYTVLEASYCGCSVVASRVGGQALLDIDGIYWFDNEDIRGFVEQLAKAMAEVGRENRSNKRQRGRRVVKWRYSLKRWGDEVMATIAQIEKKT